MDAEEILNLLDSLDFTEETINTYLNKIMAQDTYTNKQLKNSTRFLKYKLAVNKRENIDCDNDSEYEFVARLIKDAKPENVELVCEITNMVLQLDLQTIVSKSEHLLQQILIGIELPDIHRQRDETEDVGHLEVEDNIVPKILIDLKLCSSILEAVINKEEKMHLPFLQVPLENMVFTPSEKILTFFFVSTIPHFSCAVSGFNLIDRLWVCLKNANESKLKTLKALSCLSDYYLPVVEESKKHTTHSLYSIATDLEFWEIVLFGLQSVDIVVRKRAVYLIKRALENLSGSQKNININREEIVVVWDKKNEKMLKTMWDNFFVLLDTLEELQSNVVLPSLKLFESVKHLGHCWLSCAYNIGLRHDNAQVRLNCIKYRLDVKIQDKNEAEALLNALNDINLFVIPHDSNKLTSCIARALDDKQSFLNILEAIPSIKWAPVPLYYITKTLGEVVYPSLLLHTDNKNICSVINDILRISCNSPLIKKAIFAHISNLVVNSCKGFQWDDYVSIYSQLHQETPLTSFIMNPLASHIKKNLYLIDGDKNEFSEVMVKSCENIDICLLYVSGHERDGIQYFLNIINERVSQIMDIFTKPYANRFQYLPDVIFLLNTYSKTAGRSESYMVTINDAVKKHYNIILHYLLSLATSNVTVDVENIITLFEALKTMKINDAKDKDVVFRLYSHCAILLKDKECPLGMRTFAISVINYLTINNMIQHFHSEIFGFHQILAAIMNIKNDTSMQGAGKLKNTFYEKCCELLICLTETHNNIDIKELLVFVENVLECGGYDSVKFILQIINNVLMELIANESTNFNLASFLSQIWAHICELKSNKEYMVCVDEFVKLITQDVLLNLPQYNNVVVSHFNYIIELAATKRMPLYFLVKHLSSKDVIRFEGMVDVVSNILLHVVVPKKEQRITENITMDLLSKMEGIVIADIHVLNQRIQYLSIAVLNKVTDVTELNEISDRIMSEIDQILKNKTRYYSNDTTHRKLTRALQTLLFIFLKTRQVDVTKTAFWCMNLLKISHDVSVKTYILWYIALYIYSMDIPINDELISNFENNGVPLACQFMIVYFVIRHKISACTHDAPETKYALGFLLSNTMGPAFSVRLASQYYSMMLLESSSIKKKINPDKYSCITVPLTKTLGELVKAKDKAFMNLRKDYFSQTFDIVGDLTVIFIFYGMQRRTEICNEKVDEDFAMQVFREIDESISANSNDAFFMEWKGIRRLHGFTHYENLIIPGQAEVEVENSTVQKKYVPWRNMTDLEISKFRHSSKKLSELIVVASLVDRVPNLGGLARTCEVFGAMTYVIDSLQHLHDKQFQTLSVSADRWVNIEEVRPGLPLQEYLKRKKSEGYSIVAAEQTSNSVKLTEFKFPKKVLILMGHEKQGIPPNLLPLMDYCVEIPQNGVIRSLNVHVTASIFMWEYIRQKYASSAPCVIIK